MKKFSTFFLLVVLLSFTCFSHDNSVLGKRNFLSIDACDPNTQQTATANTVTVPTTTANAVIAATATSNAVTAATATSNAVTAATATANTVNATATATTNTANAAATANTINATATATTNNLNAAATANIINATATATTNTVNAAATANIINATATATTNTVNAAATANDVNATATATTNTVNAAATANTVNATATATTNSYTAATGTDARSIKTTLQRSNACCSISTATASKEQPPTYITTQTSGQSNTSSGVLAYTRYNIEQNGKVTPTRDNVKQVAYTYTAGKFTLTTRSAITTLPEAYGIVTLPDGSLVIGGDETTWKVDPKTGAKQLVNPSGNVISDHVTYDSQNNVIWTSGDNPPTTLAKIPLTAFGSNTSGTPVQLKGDDRVVSAIALDSSHNGYYTSSSIQGDGTFGIINLTTLTTTRKLSNLPAAHEIIYDPFTNTLILAGANHITQIDVNTLSVISDWTAPAQYSGLQLNQNTTDGQGHMWVASNNGNLVFIDFSHTRKVADPTNYVSIQHLDTNLDNMTLECLN